jgi:glutaredoxin
MGLIRTGLLWLFLLVQAGMADARAEAVLLVYVRADCPHCAQAKAWLPELERSRPGLEVIYRPVDTDPVARDELMSFAHLSGTWPPGVPTFVYRGHLYSGFDAAASSGPEIAAMLDGAAAAPGAGNDIDAGWLGRLSVTELGLPAFTLAIGLLDGFNPCAMWVLLFLLSMLVHLKDRRRMALIAGTFVMVSGAVYFVFMAAWLNLFLAVGLSSTLRIALALLALTIGAINMKDFFKPGAGPSLSIPGAAKPGLYARMRRILAARTLGLSLLGVTALAVLVNLVELLCTAGLPAMYTAILAQHDLSPAAHYGYLALYIAGYITDDALMVGAAVWALSSSKLSAGAGRWLKLVSGLVMALLGVLMLVKPEWLF